MLRCIVLLVAIALPVYAAVPAMFRGRVVEIADQPQSPGMIFVLGPNGSLRKVQTHGAHVEYAPELPAKYRLDEPSKSLVHGSEIRVEAEENGHGLWKAKSIEILRVPGSPKPKEYAPPAPKHAPTLSRRTS